MLRKSIIVLTIIIIAILCNKGEDVVYETKYNDIYYGYLIIPSIDMKLGFYNYDNELNNVNKNIELINTGIKDTYLLAGHSGTGKVSFFNDLRYIKKGDIIILKIKGNTEEYIVKNIRNDIKNGKLRIRKESGWLYLTTCKQNPKGYQMTIEAFIKNDDN